MAIAQLGMKIERNLAAKRLRTKEDAESKETP